MAKKPIIKKKTTVVVPKKGKKAVGVHSYTQRANLAKKKGISMVAAGRLLKQKKK